MQDLINLYKTWHGGEISQKVSGKNVNADMNWKILGAKNSTKIL